MGPTIRNWAKTRTFRPTQIHHPKDEAEVVEVVKRAVEAGDRVKAVGGALSWSDCFDIPAQAIRMDKMAAVVSVDHEKRRIRVQGGAVLKHVNEALAENGLAFDNFGSIVIQTAAGYTGTGSHGTGGRTPVLSSYLTAMRFVDGTGEVRELSAEQDPEMFRVARVHLGALGVVTELEFQCVEGFHLEEQLELLDFETVLSNLDAYVDGADYCKLWWLPYTKKVQVYSFRRTEAPRTRLTFPAWLDETGLSVHLFAGMMGLSRLIPPITRPMHRLMQGVHFRPRKRVDRSDKVIKYAGTIPWHLETEYAIGREHAAEAIDRVRKTIETTKDFRVNFPLEIRFVAADDIPMSPAFGRDSCYIGGYVGSRRWAPPYFAAVEEIVADYGGRPHWGKDFDRTAKELRALYPQYDDFAAVRTQCDPHDVFRNAFIDRVFPVT